MSKSFITFNAIVFLFLSFGLYQMHYENNRLDRILAEYSEIESRAIYVSGCIYGGGNYETCTNAYYSHFLPRTR